MALRSFLSRAARTVSQRRSFASDESVKKTALYDFHVSLGGKMVPFAGWAMPVQYKEGIIQSHMHCRTSASLFDVSHMGQLQITGKDRVAFIESLVPGDIASLELNSARLTQFTTEQGGILDDTIVTRREDHLFVIVNAGCTDQDLELLNAAISKWRSEGKDVQLNHWQDRSLLALQGPRASEVLQRLAASASDKEVMSTMPFMSGRYMTVAGIPNCIVTRCGYTGEDGYEVSVPSDRVVSFAQALLDNQEVQVAGLGPRDSLRLEAGLCLMGHDMNSSITPIEAGLAWTISKRRRAEGGFPGAAVIQRQLKEGVSKKRIGFLSSGAPAREHSLILSQSGEKIGEVTSGSFSPCLKRPIGMGYVETKFAENGTKVQVEVRGKTYEAEIAKMPFVPQQYYRSPAAVKK